MFNPDVTPDNPPVSDLIARLVKGEKFDIVTWVGTGIQRFTIDRTDYFYDDVVPKLSDSCPSPFECVESDVIRLRDGITVMSTIAYRVASDE